MRSGRVMVASLILDGGAGNDFLFDDVAATSGAPGATLIGGTGNDTIYGGTGSDTIYGDTTGAEAASDGSDNIDGGGGVDNVQGGGGDDVIKVSMPATATPSVDAGSGSDFLVITSSPGNDDLIVTSPSIHTVRVAYRSASGAVTASHVEELDIDLSAGADKLEINPLAGSDVTLVSVVAGQIVTDTGQTQLVPSAEDPSVKIRQKIFTIAPDNAADVITVKGGSGDDSFSITSVDPVNNAMTDIRVVHTFDADVLISKQIRAEGDTLVIDGAGRAAGAVLVHKRPGTGQVPGSDPGSGVCTSPADTSGTRYRPCPKTTSASSLRLGLGRNAWRSPLCSSDVWRGGLPDIPAGRARLHKSEPRRPEPRRLSSF